MPRFLTLVLIVCCSALNAFSADTPGAIAQLRRGVDTEFSREGSKEERALAAIAEYQRVLSDYPDCVEQVTIASGNIARICAHELRDYDKARKIYAELLQKELKPQAAENYARGYVYCVIRSTPSKMLERGHADALGRFGHHRALLSVEYATACLVKSMHASTADAQVLRETARGILSDLLLKEKDIDLAHGMTARHLLGQIPMLRLAVEAQAMARSGNPPPGGMAAPLVGSGPLPLK